MRKSLLKILIISTCLGHQACGYSQNIPENFASFNCSLAKTPVEKAICASNDLSQLDREMSKLYRDELLRNSAIKRDQTLWLKGRNKCQESLNANECLTASYKKRIQDLSSSAQKTPNLSPVALQELFGAAPSCSSHSQKTEPPFIEIFDLKNGSKVLLLTCDEGAYQNSYLGYLVQSLDNLKNAVPLVWERPIFEEKWVKTKISKITGNFSFDAQASLLEVSDRSNGAGTCGSITTYDLSRLSGSYVPLLKAVGEDDCLAGVGMDEWGDIDF